MTISGREVADAISSTFKRGGVAGQDCAGLADLIELGEDFFLQGHAFKDRFNHHVHFTELVIAQSRSDELEAFVHELLGESSALYGDGIVLLDVGHAAIERCLISFFEQDREAGIGKHHGNAAAHGAGADNGHVLYWNNRRVFGNVRHFGDFAFTEEDMDQGFGLVGEETFHEEPLLFRAALFKWQLRGGFHGVDGSNGRHQPALLFADIFTRGGKDGGVLFRLAEFFIALARFGGGLSGNFTRKGHRALEQIALNHAIDQAQLRAFFGRDRLAVHAHLQRLGDSRLIVADVVFRRRRE